MTLSPSVRSALRAAARGASLCAAACLLFLPLDPGDLERLGQALTLIAFGATAAACRSVLVGRSLTGTMCMWASVAVVFTDVLALAPTEYGLIPAQMLEEPLRFYASLCSSAVLLGLGDLFVEAVLALPALAGRAALVGIVQGLVCAGLVLTFALVASRSSTAALGQAFEERFLSSLRVVWNTVVCASCLLGCATVTLAVYTREGRRVLDVARAVALAAVLWAVVPAILLFASPPFLFSGGRQVPAIGLVASSRTLVPLYGLGLGLMFSLVWAFLHLRMRALQLPVDRVDPARARPMAVLVALVGLASIAVQIEWAAWVPLDRLQSGQAWLRPSTLTPTARGQKVLFSPDGATLWLGDRYGVRAAWRVGPGDARWRPIVDFEEAPPVRACSPEDRRAITLPRHRSVRLLEIVDRPSARSLQVFDGRSGTRLAVWPVHAGPPGGSLFAGEGVSLREDLAFGSGSAGPWVLRWRTGEWWGRDLEEWPTLSPDGRYLLARASGSIACYEISSGRAMVSRDLPHTLSAAFDVSSRKITVMLLSGERLVVDIASGRLVASPNDWADEARSPDGRLGARAEPWGVSLRLAGSGRRLASMYLRLSGRQCVVAPDGRCNGDLGLIEIVDEDTVMPVHADYPLYDSSLYPVVH